MVQFSPRMGWSYPARDDDPWYDPFVDFVQGVDASAFAHREDRSVIWAGGGTLSWTLGTGTLTWTDTINVYSPLGGRLLQIAAGSVAGWVEGEVLYVPLVRQPAATTAVTLTKAAQVPSDDNAMALAIRVGGSIFFRTGVSLGDGDSVAGVAPVAGGSSTDVNAIHDNVAGEIAAIAPKATPTGLDRMVIEDQADSDNKKSITLADLPAAAPASHASTHEDGGIDAMDIDATPSTGSLRTLGAGGQQACAGDDSRLSDARTPTAHGTSHESGGSDDIKLDDLAAPDDNTDLNATTGAHGLLRKLDGVTTNFLRGDGAWASPGSGTDVNAIHVSTAAEISGITEKTAPVGADLVVIEDSEDTNNKKRVQLFNIPAGRSVSVRDYGATGGGTSDDYSDINDAITAIGSSVADLVLPEGNYYIGTSLATHANTRVVLPHGAVIQDNADAGISLTINGRIEASPGQHFNFTGSGSSVQFSDACAFATDVRVSWFGLTETGLQNALDSNATSLFIDGTVTVVNGVTYPDKITIHGLTMGRFEGARPYQEIIFAPTSNDTICFQYENAGSAVGYNVFFRDLYIWANDSTKTGIEGVKFEDIRYGGMQRVTLRFNQSISGTVAAHINANFSYCTGLKFDDCRFTGATNVLSDKDGALNNTEVSFTSCHFRLNAYGLDIQNGINYLAIGCDFQASTASALRVANKGLCLVKNFFENNNVGIEFATGGSNAVLLGNGYNINTTNVSNPNAYNYIRLDAREDNIVVGSLGIRADEETGNTTRMTFPTSGQAAANDWYVYDEGNSDNVIRYDKSEELLYSEKGTALPWGYETQTANFNVALDRAGIIYNNRGIASEITGTLPAASSGIYGWQYTFIAVSGTYDLLVDPNGTNRIRGGGDGKYLRLAAGGSSVTLACVATGVWEVVSSNGLYSFEA